MHQTDGPLITDPRAEGLHRAGSGSVYQFRVDILRLLPDTGQLRIATWPMFPVFLLHIPTTARNIWPGGSVRMEKIHPPGDRSSPGRSFG